MPTRFAFAVVLVAAAGAAGLWFLSSSGDAPEPSVGIDPGEPVPAAAVNEPMPPKPLQAQPIRDPTPEQRRFMVRLPNGDYLPALNGCVDAKPMQWPEGDPYSPVVGTRVSPDGTEWYVHENGFLSTTHWTYQTYQGERTRVVATRVSRVTTGVSPTPVLGSEALPGEAGKAPPK